MAAITSDMTQSECRCPKGGRTPPLEQGDRLSRIEFFQRYEAMPPNVKAERIEGMVHMAAALTFEFHGQPHADIITWLGVYRAATPGVVAGDNSTILLDTDNDPQPDACLRILPTHGGQTRINQDGYIEGAPELIVEVTASTVSFDLGAKLNTYRRNGVREYVVYRVYDGEFDWFVLRQGNYVRLNPDARNIYRSEVFPGLWLKADVFIAANLAEVLSVLKDGRDSAEHQEFVGRLALATKTM
jgi:Uma2 family endonuclease